MSTETTTTTTDEEQIDRQDTIENPQGREYSVVSRYRDGYGSIRVHLRHTTRRQMYVSLTRLQQMLTEGWNHTNE